MTTDLRAETEAIAATLDRHERRRGQGLPTVSTLAGPVGLSLNQARVWAEARGRSVVRIAVPNPDAAIDAWVARLVAENDLRQSVIAWLARRLGRPEADLGPRLRRMTPFERDTFLDDALADAAGAGLDVVGRHLLAGLASGTPLAPESLAADLVAAGLPHCLPATTLLELVPGTGAPLFLLIPVERSETPGEPTLGRWAELAAGLVEAAPGRRGRRLLPLPRRRCLPARPSQGPGTPAPGIPGRARPGRRRRPPPGRGLENDPRRGRAPGATLPAELTRHVRHAR